MSAVHTSDDIHSFNATDLFRMDVRDMFQTIVDQLVSTYISLGQVKNTGPKPQVTGYCLPIQEVSLTFINANLWPKSFFV